MCCKNTELSGSISFGRGCIIHPGCSIISEKGEIVFGEGNIVEERVRIVNKKDKPMYIGSYNNFEVGTVVESSTVGDCNVFQFRSRVREGCVIGNGCNLTPCSVL